MLELYTIDGCSRCHLVKSHLVESSTPFIEKNLFEESRFVEELMHLNHHVVTPALVKENKVFTGEALWHELELNK